MMPRIYLKPNSAEFADEQEKQPGAGDRLCDMPGCAKHAAHKAPKDRSLSEYYSFCLEHAQEYNKAWDFFAGMSPSDIEAHIVRSTHWDRPTRPSFDGAGPRIDDILRARAGEYYSGADETRNDESAASHDLPFSRLSPEYEAMAVMELTPPLTLAKVKERYKTLVKRHHPDVNRDDPGAGELLKRINMAYTILKLAYEKYKTLEE